MITENQKHAIDQVRVLLNDLIECGTWFSSSLEIDEYSKNSDGKYWDGDILKSRIHSCSNLLSNTFE
jgi:hypothetical protein